MTELTGPYGEGTLSLVSPNCVHSPTQRPSTQAGVSQPAAPCPSSALSQEPWTHRHSSFPSCTLYRSRSRETWGLGGGGWTWTHPREGLRLWNGFWEHETLSSCEKGEQQGVRAACYVLGTLQTLSHSPSCLFLIRIHKKSLFSFPFYR